MNDRTTSEKFQDVKIYQGWVVAVRFVSEGQYQAVVVNPLDLEIGNSVACYGTISIALTEAQKWIDRYLAQDDRQSI